MSDAANQWTNFYTTNTEMMYPAEAVIRIFKGAYPNLKMPKPRAIEAPPQRDENHGTLGPTHLRMA